ncbi:putative zinc- or iron-chelating domain containing protein [Vibrio phage vB_VhaS_R21Y]|nr:putative zinc- or iron-chelating domain containing protein [Vibrio phage vB_VhaS_R21Y]
MSLCIKPSGEWCAACCIVVSLYNFYSHAELKRHRRAFNKRAKLSIELGMLREIPRRIAKKRNRFLFDKLKAGGELKRYRFFKCVHHSNGKCNNYDHRPHMCSGYPFYGLKPHEWLTSENYKRGAQYDRECGYYDPARIIKTFKLGEQEHAQTEQ